MQQRDRAAYLGRLQRGERRLVQPEQEREGAAVILERRRREAPLVLKRGEIVLGVLGIHYRRAATPAAQSSPMRRR